MSRRGGSRSTFGVFQIVAGIAALLGVGIVLALMFAPEKPPAPPTSKVTYRAESPKEKKKNADDGDFAPLPNIPGLPNAPGQQAAAAEKKEEAKKELPFKITGLVVDARTKAVLDGAVVTVKRVWSPAEQRDWEARSAAARLGTDQTEARTLREERDRLQRTERTRTKDDGRFEIALDVPGQYECEAVHKQYMLQKANAGAVSEEDPIAEVQIGLSPGATISGKVTEVGSVTPAAEVRVTIENDGVHSATTDATGAYEIAGLAPGEYGVSVNTRGTAYKPGRTLPYQKVLVQSISQDVRNINFEVEPAGVVWGYILTPDKQPIKGAEVLLTSPESILSQAITAAVKQAPPVRSTSQEDGYYELLGVPINEEWRVYATASSASPQVAESFMLTSEVRSVQIDVYLSGGSDVHGFVVDSKGKAISDAQIACIPSYSKILSPMDTPAAFREAKSGPDGSFTIEKLPAGDYQLLGRKQGFKIPTAGVPLYPDGSSSLDNIEVRLLPVDEGTHYVTGTVSDVQTAEGISGASVKLEGMGGETFNNFSRDASTDSRGEFTIDGLEAGMYRLRVEKEGYAPKTLPRVLLDTETKIVLDKSAVVRGVVLVKETNRPPAGEYTVAYALLTDEGNVNIFGTRDLNDGNPATTFSNVDGSFQLFLSPGNYRLEARAQDYAKGRQVIAAAAGEVVDNVTLYVSQAGGVIAGQVRTKTGDSPTGTRVTLVEDGNAVGSAATGGTQEQTVGEDGAFQFNNLTAGSYYAIASNANFANARSRVVAVSEGQQVDGVDITLGSGGSIAGLVYRLGKPQVGATVTALSAETGSTGTATTDGSGAYEITDLGAGEYNVTWIPSGSGSITDLNGISSKPVRVAEGQQAQLNFGVDGVNFTGRCTQPPVVFLYPVNWAVLQPVGSPLPATPGQEIGQEALVQLQGAYLTQVQGSGQFTFERIPQGEYQLLVFFGSLTGGGPGGGGGQAGGLRFVGFEPVVQVTDNAAPVTVQVNY